MGFHKAEAGPIDNFFKSAREETSTICEAEPQGIKQDGGSIKVTTGAGGKKVSPRQAGTVIDTNAKWLASLEPLDCLVLFIEV